MKMYSSPWRIENYLPFFDVRVEKLEGTSRLLGYWKFTNTSTENFTCVNADEEGRQTFGKNIVKEWVGTKEIQ